MIETPNITLATKNTGRCLQVQEMKNEGAERSTISWTSESNNSKIMVSGKSLTKSVKDLHGHSNPIVDSNEWIW